LTDAVQQMQWWNNDVCKVSVFEMDARVGGRVRTRVAEQVVDDLAQTIVIAEHDERLGVE